ncbi:MAG: hypothetical protein Kow0068_09960 [Marinilabiliales bacterium]
MYIKALILLGFIIISLFAFGQVSNEKDIKKFIVDNQISIAGNSGIGEVNGIDFRRRRFANIGVYSDMGLGFVNSGLSVPVFSANADILIESKENHMFSIRFGGGVLMNDGNIEPFFPLYLNFLFGYKNMIETSVGGHLYLSSHENEGTQVFPAGIIGYRHQHPRGGIIYGLLLYLTFPQRQYDVNYVDYAFEPWVVARIGWAW